jgi:FkbM family methyltransferase
MTNLPVLKCESKYGDLLYAIANDHTAWRVKTIYSKEPDTIAWIDSMSPGETFVDVGANMGIYTIYAAKRGLAVYAFEPEAQNYALLCRSIMVNEMEVPAYCVALSDEWNADWLYLSGFLPGGSCHTAGADLNHRLEKRDRPVGPLKQGCLSVPLDNFDIKADHAKIDVDGLEHRVLSGGIRTFTNCKSVLIEINQALSEHQQLIHIMEDLGFRRDMAQVHAATRTEGTFKGCGNQIFRR